MPEDPEAAGEQATALPVPLGVLGDQEPHQGLGDGEPDHDAPSVGGVPEAAGAASQVSRIQACSGSSVIRQARSSCGPAMTLR